MLNKDFEKGMLYERKKKTKSLYLWLGYGCVFFGVAYSFNYMFNPIISNLWLPLFLEIFGFACLYIAHSEKKELKKLNLARGGNVK